MADFLRRLRPNHSRSSENGVVDPELKLPGLPSLSIMIMANVLAQLSMFIIVSSSNEYAQYLGGDSTFSGLIIGVGPLMGAVALIPVMRYDKGGYRRPLYVSCISFTIGMVLYALAFQADYLYLSLIGRMFSGIGFIIFMYCKKYCSDARIVGIRRRTTLASWLVMGQGVGMSLGPFAGGLLTKIGLQNKIFNGYTAPGWIMAILWASFGVCVMLWFEDPNDIPQQANQQEAEDAGVPMQVLSSSNDDSKSQEAEVAEMNTAHSTAVSRNSSSSTVRLPEPPRDDPISFRSLTKGQVGVIVCMCWFAMTCFFVLAGWEANLPVFGADYPEFHWSPFAAGNFIALGGVTTFPFLIANLLFARKVQDRHILASGSVVGVLALFTFLGLVKSGKLNYVGAFFCWWGVALGFNIATTVTMSLLSKQLPADWNGRTSMVIQYSNYTGRVTGAIWGGSGVAVGMPNYISLEIAFIGIGAVMFTSLWRDLKAKTG